MDANDPSAMTDRERFRRWMHYEPADRCPIWDFGFLDETIRRWEQQGLPHGANTDELFGMDGQWRFCTPNILLAPPFEAELLEDRGDRELWRQPDGVVVVKLKQSESMPEFVSFPVNNRTEWNAFKQRLDPRAPGRIPDDWEAQCRSHLDRDYPLLLWGGSLYGMPRDWMGVEGLSLALYRDKTLFPEMVETLADMAVAIMDEALERAQRVGVTFDAVNMWEDMCYKDGPLVNPKLVREVMLPHYRRIVDVYHKYGVDVIFLDCDGKIDAMIDIWMDAGINCIFPIEIGAWNADPIAFRKKYGRDLLMMGGFDKRIMARGPEAIDAEVARLAPTVAQGGFIPFCDHRVPPDVSLRNYVHYLDRAKQVWGGSVNTRPTWRPDNTVARTAPHP